MTALQHRYIIRILGACLEPPMAVVQVRKLRGDGSFALAHQAATKARANRPVHICRSWRQPAFTSCSTTSSFDLSGDSSCSWQRTWPSRWRIAMRSVRLFSTETSPPAMFCWGSMATPAWPTLG